MQQEISEFQKDKNHKKKMIQKHHHQNFEKNSFGKENAKKNRKATGKRIVNDYLTYGEYEDDYETYEKFGKR